MRRRRRCDACGHKFSTAEVVIVGPVVVFPGEGGRSVEVMPLRPWIERCLERASAAIREAFSHDDYT